MKTAKPETCAGPVIADAPDPWTAAMRRGDFHAAFVIQAAELARRDPATRDDPRLPHHLRWVWGGRPFDGAHVLVRCYRSLGDTLMFSRFPPRLAARGQRHRRDAAAAGAAVPGVSWRRPADPL